jgi:hypothetical protein
MIDLKKIRAVLQKHHDKQLCKVGHDPRHSLTKLMVSAYQQSALCGETESVLAAIDVELGKPPVAYMVTNKSWQAAHGDDYFELRLPQDMPEPAFDGDKYDVEIPLMPIP